MWNFRIRQPSGLVRVILLFGITPLAGCLDAQGNRITAQEWFASRGGSGQSEEAAEGGARQKAKAASEADPPRQDGEVPTTGRGAPASPPESAEPADRITAAVSSRQSASGPPSSHAIRSDVLLVNGETVSVSDILESISAELERLAAELPPMAYGAKAGEMIRQEIVESVAQHLIWRKAKQMLNEDMEKGLKKAVDKMEKDRINREFQGRETLYDKYLAKHNKTRDEVRERLRRSIVIDSYLRERLLPLVQSPRKQELLNYYNANLAEFSEKGRREMYLIDVPAAAFFEARRRPTEDERRVAMDKAREEIQRAADALRGGEPFEQVAKTHSRGSTAEQGGNWGMIEQPLQGRWQAPSKRLFEMKEGETSEIIETPDGFFIVKAGKVEPGKTQTFDEAQTQIANTLKQRRFLKLRADFLQNELKQSTIGSLEEFVAEVLRAVPEPKTAGR